MITKLGQDYQREGRTLSLIIITLHVFKNCKYQQKTYLINHAISAAPLTKREWNLWVLLVRQQRYGPSNNNIYIEFRVHDAFTKYTMVKRLENQ